MELETGTTRQNSNTPLVERLKFNNGVATVTLRADESVQIYKIPTGTELKVAESDYGDYTPSHQVNQGETVVGDTTGTISIADDKVQEVDFTNHLENPEFPPGGGDEEEPTEEATPPIDESGTPNAGGSESATPGTGTGTSGAGGSVGSGTSAGSGKGLLPQTAEFFANNWLIILEILILLNLIAWHIRNRYYDRKK